MWGLFILPFIGVLGKILELIVDVAKPLLLNLVDVFVGLLRVLEVGASYIIKSSQALVLTVFVFGAGVATDRIARWYVGGIPSACRSVITQLHKDYVFTPRKKSDPLRTSLDWAKQWVR